MSTGSRASLTYGVALIGGCVLFFLCFAAIFNGSWSLLLFTDLTREFFALTEWDTALF